MTEGAGHGVTGANLLDGASQETLVTLQDAFGQGGPVDVALDITGGKMYWIDQVLTGHSHSYERSLLMTVITAPPTP